MSHDHDLEKNIDKPSIEVESCEASVGSVEKLDQSKWQNFKDSFKPADLSQYDDANLTEVEKAALATANSPLSKSLKSRHLQMIAIGGAIGTGLFVGSGKVLSIGGPAGMLIGYSLIGMMLYCTVHALGELAVLFPVAGAFCAYSSRFIDPAWGFAMGWNYGVQWLVTFPLELVAATITIDYWNPGVNNAAWVCIFYVVVMVINLFGVKGYGEAECLFSMIKVVAVLGYIILGIILNCGGGPQGGYIGGKYWHHPGAFAHGFKGVCASFVTAAFAFTGTEFVGLAAAETKNPRKNLPSATKQVFWRIILFYVVCLTLVGLLVPYTDDRLLGSSNASASPFVISIVDAGIKGLPSVINVVIMIAVLSVGNAAVYGSSRTLASLSAQGLGPKWLGYIDRKGRPLGGIVVSLIVGLLCFASASSQEAVVFEWLMALCGLSAIFTWASICVCHIRFRQAMKYHGRSLDEIPFKSQAGVLGSYFGVILNVLVLIAQFWVALFPIGEPANVVSFFQNFLAAPIAIVFYVIWKVWKRPPFMTLDKIDIMTGRRDVDVDLLQQELKEEKEYLKSRPIWYRIFKFWC